MTARPKYALWLLPEDPAALQNAIEALSAAHAAPRFEAHLTLLAGFELRDQASARGALDRLSAEVAPIALPVLGTGESDVYFETAFVRCAETAALTALRDRVRGALGPGHVSAIGPHVSLVYADLAAETRRAIARAQVAIAGQLRFSALALVQSGPVGWQPVAHWSVLSRHALRG